MTKGCYYIIRKSIMRANAYFDNSFSGERTLAKTQGGCFFPGRCPFAQRDGGRSTHHLSQSAILLHITGKLPMPVDSTPHKQNTFVKPAELAHVGQARLYGSCEAGRPPVPQRPHSVSCNSGMLRMFHNSRKFAIRWMCHRMAEHPWHPSEMTG